MKSQATISLLELECCKEHLNLRIQLNYFMSVKGLFDDDIDIFLFDLESSERQKVEAPKKIHNFYEDQPKTHQTRKESEDYSKQSSKNKNTEKAKESKAKLDRENLMKIQEGVEYKEIQKKQRNRLAAKQSRDRKKMYIELMENQHRKLDQDLALTDQKIIQTKKKIGKFVSENKILTGFNTLSQLENKFDKILKSKSTPDVDIEINTMLDSMRYRLGATGKQRVRKVNQFFKQIVNLSLPPVLRYLVWDCTEKKHLFRSEDIPPQEVDEFYGELLKYVPEIPKYQKQFKKISEDLSCKKDGLLRSLQSLKQIKNYLKLKCNQIEDEIDDIREILTPTQCLFLIMIINKKRYNQNIDYLNARLLNMCEDESGPRKRVKLQRQDQDNVIDQN